MMERTNDTSARLIQAEQELRDIAESMSGELSVVQQVYRRTLDAAQQLRDLASRLPSSEE